MRSESRPFVFTTRWSFAHPCESVWDALADVESWPAWWPGVESARVVRRGDSSSRDTEAVVVVRSRLGYALRFAFLVTRAHRPVEACIEVTGDLRGTGRWTARSAGAETDVEFTWDVVTPRRVVRLLRPLAGWAHARVMRQGRDALEEYLRASTSWDGSA